MPSHHSSTRHEGARHPKRRALALAAGLAGASWALAASGGPVTSEGESWVSLGGQPVAAAHVQSALLRCKAYEAELPTQACIDRYFVPLWLLDRKAQDERAQATPTGKKQVNQILFEALVERTQAAVPAPTEAEVAAVFTANKRDFERPERIRIFRILTKTEGEAKGILAKLKPDTTAKDFRQLARDHSVDRATHERGGDLGFVWPDGSTDVPQVRADAALYTAAKSVADGAFVREPVAEGKLFAVIWRRGSLPEDKLPEASVRQLIGERLRAKRATEAVDALIADKTHAVVKNHDLLKRLARDDCKIFTR